MSIFSGQDVLLDIKDASFDNLAEQQTWLNELLANEWNAGFYMANVQLISKTTDSLEYSLLKGSLLRIDRISLLGVDEKWAKALARNFELKNLSLTSNNLSAVMNEALFYFENSGYPFAKVWLDSPKIVNGGLVANLKIDESLFFTFYAIEFNEDVKMSTGFLQNYLGLKTGEPFNYSKAKKIRELISSLPYVKLVREPFVSFSDKGKVRIYLQLENVQVSSFDGIIGVAPQSGNSGTTLFTGQFDFRLRNPFARGISFDFAFEKFQESSQKLNTKLEYPFLLSTSLGLDFQFDLLKVDTSYINLTTRLGFSYFFSGNSKMSAFYNQFRAYPLGNNLESRGALQNLTTNNYGLSYKGASLDYLPNPLRGIDFYIEASVGKKEIVGEEGSSSTIASFNHKVDFFIPLAKKLTILLRNRSQLTLDSSFGRNQVLWIGGLKSIRGFNEGAIPAKSFLQQTVEIRYLVDKNSHAKIFHDLANVSQFNETGQLEGQWYNGFGLGYNFKTGPGIFTINYAVGSAQNSGISLTNGKVHFGFVSYF